MREVVQFLSDLGVYFDFSTRQLYLEDGTSISVQDYQSDLLRLFASQPNTEISSRQIATPDFVDSPLPDNYYESISTDSDNQLARNYINELRKIHFVINKMIQVKSRFGYVYTGNRLMQVEDDWKPDCNSFLSVTTIPEVENSFPYEGDQPFVFVSYAHKNSDEVMDILNQLKEHGLRIWYDQGIEWGSEWPQSIAEHLKRCNIFLAFHSGESILSHNCRQEVTYAIKNKKTILSIYLEDILLPDGMDMQLTLYQAIYKKTNEPAAMLADRLIKHKMMQSCIASKVSASGEKKDLAIEAEKLTTSETLNSGSAILKFYPIVLLGSVLGAISSIFILEYITAVDQSDLMIIITSLVILLITYCIGSAMATANLKDNLTNSSMLNNWIGLFPYFLAILFSMVIPPLTSLVISLVSAFIAICLIALCFGLIFTLFFRVGKK